MTVPFIGEDIIDEVTASLSDNEAYYNEIVADMQGKQPILFSYLLSESFKLLTKEESDYLFYLAVVIWKSLDEHVKALPILTSDLIENVEEKNWTIFNESKARGFRDKLDAFFYNYPQEDLLAFVEDALVDDEDSFVTKEGRELLFIGLRTTIDTLCGISA
ncbi:MAG: hypothetical protein AAGJ18_26230, partial [Bacteroidota bacterium]